MNVIFSIVWQVIVDDKRHLLHVNATSLEEEKTIEI